MNIQSTSPDSYRKQKWERQTLISRAPEKDLIQEREITNIHLYIQESISFLRTQW